MKIIDKKVIFRSLGTLIVLLFVATSLYGQWSAAELTVPRKNLAATSVGTKALFAGGNDQNNNNFSTVDIYDYITGEWSTHTLSKGRQALRATSFGTKAFFAGGVGSSGLLANVDMYDDSKTTNQWTSFSLGTARAHIGIAAAGGKVFFAGGQVSCGNCYTDNIEVYDIGNNSLVASLTMRTARGYLTAAAVGTKVLFAGGINSSSAFISEVDIYDTNTGTWTYTNLLSGGRSHLTAVVNGTKVFFAGGRDGSGSGASKDVDIYDVSNGSWQSTTLSEARAYIHSASIGDKVFFGGGYAGTANLPCDLNNPSDPNLPEHIAKTSQTFDIYDVSTGQMLPATTLPGGKRFSLAATRVGATQVVFGGGAGPCNEASAAVDIYDLDPLVEITKTDFEEELGDDDKIGIEVDDDSKVASVQVYIRGISKSEDEFDDPIDATKNGNSFEYDPALGNDEIGFVYFFEITDKYGRILRSDTATSYNLYASGSPKVTMSVKKGDKEIDYQIVSVPLELKQKKVETVFSGLGSYNIKKWRLYEYSSEEENREFKSSGAFTDIIPGKGYWLITRDGTTINVGAGSTVRKSRGEEFEIPLPTGWSLIGNPYNFKISWQDILDHNPGFSSSQGLQTFSGGNLANTPTIDKYRGAFVYNPGTAKSLKIPVKRNTSLGSRIATPESIDLSAPNWQLPLELTDGSLTNQLGGIGMNKGATFIGLDDFDGLAVPMLAGIGMPGIVFPHPDDNMNFSREVVPTQSEYIWNIDIERGSDKTLTLRWNNENFKESQKHLLLYDPSAQHMVDMKIKNTYTLPPTASSLQVMMGGEAFINKKRDELLPLFGTPYPNPAVDKIYVPFWIPEKDGAMEISIKVYTLLGAEVKTLAADSYQKGGHQLVWDIDEQSGMYLIHMKANNQYSKWAKITVR